MEPTRRLQDWQHMLAMGLVMAIIAGGLAYLFLNVDFMPVPASTQRELMDPFIQVLFAIAGVVFAVIVVILGYSLIFFRRKPGDETDARGIKGILFLELTWTIIPLAIVIILGTYGAVILDKMGADPMTVPTPGNQTELVINVTAQRFSWQFEYPKYAINSPVLEVPVNTPILFNLNSKDVVHSFWVQEWGPKQDAVPGLTTTLRITPDKVGSYQVQCSQLCGIYHTYMTAPVMVVTAADFDTWVKQQTGK